MLTALRALGRAGLVVGAADGAAACPAFRSRWCRLTARLPRPEVGAGPLGGAILSLLDGARPDVLICANDGTIEAIRARRDEIERRSAVALAAEPALAIAVSKERTLDLARELGLTVPRGVAISSPEEVAGALAETGLPAVVKPDRSWLGGADGRRASPVAVIEAREAIDVVTRLTGAGVGAVVQQWLPGRREAVSLVRAKGRIWARFAQVALRMLPAIGGSSVVRESIAPPADAAKAAERLLEAMGLEGYAEVEFRRDAAGRPALMEVNPRLSASVEIAVRAGVNFPLLLHRWAIGAPLAACPGYRVGLRMRWLGGDVRLLAESVANGGRPDVSPWPRALGRFVADFVRPAAYDYVSLDDPRPMAAAVRASVAHWSTTLARAATAAAARR